MSGAYYNEIDPYAAAWLRNLIAAGHIAPGDVDERSIVDVRADELRGYTQCHFFAGVGVWSRALRFVGWPDEEEVWSGSCPCQPFSDAGQGEAFDDERDLWPDWFPLIRERRPRVVFGEQVASRLGLAWIDALHADLEGEAYTVGAVDTCSAGFGSPNIRQRLYWVADADQRGGGRHAGAVSSAQEEAGRRLRGVGDGLKSRGADGGLADADGWLECDGGIQRGGEHGQRAQDGGAGGVAKSASIGPGAGLRDEEQRRRRDQSANGGDLCGVGDASSRGCGERGHEAQPRRGGHADGTDQDHRPGPLNGFWRAADWLCCTDGKWRPVEPGTFPLVTGAPGRLGRLRAYGNAINAEVAAGFIGAYMHLKQHDGDHRA